MMPQGCQLGGKQENSFLPSKAAKGNKTKLQVTFVSPFFCLLKLVSAWLLRNTTGNRRCRNKKQIWMQGAASSKVTSP